MSMPVGHTDKAKSHYSLFAYKEAIHAIIQSHNTDKSFYGYNLCDRRLSVINTFLDDYNKLVNKIVLNDPQKRNSFLQALWHVLMEAYGIKPFQLPDQANMEKYGIETEHWWIMTQFVKYQNYIPNYNDSFLEDWEKPWRVEQPVDQNVVSMPDHIVRKELDNILKQGKEKMVWVDAEKALEQNLLNPHSERSQDWLVADQIESEKKEDIEKEWKQSIEAWTQDWRRNLWM